MTHTNSAAASAASAAPNSASTPASNSLTLEWNTRGKGDANTVQTFTLTNTPFTGNASFGQWLVATAATSPEVLEAIASSVLLAMKPAAQLAFKAGTTSAAWTTSWDAFVLGTPRETKYMSDEAAQAVAEELIPLWKQERLEANKPVTPELYATALGLLVAALTDKAPKGISKSVLLQVRTSWEKRIIASLGDATMVPAALKTPTIVIDENSF